MLSLSIRKLCTHPTSSYGIYTLQANVRFRIFKFSWEIIFFILTLSTHLGFTLHTVIWFTLSKHILGSTFSNFYGSSFFHTYTLHTCSSVHSPYSYLVYTLQTHVSSKLSNCHRRSFFHTYTLHTWFRVHSPYSYLVYTLQAHARFKIFLGDHFFQTYTLHTCFSDHSPYTYLVYTLQTHVRFKIFRFSWEIIFSYLRSPHIQGSLSIQLFRLHSPNTY